MDAFTISPPMRRALAGAAFAALAAVASASLAAPGASTKGDESARGPGAPRVETDRFVAEMKAVGPYAVGKEGTVEVTLVPKGEYHLNAQYPYKLVMGEAAGVTFKKNPLVRADGAFDEQRGSFRVAFVPGAAGRLPLSATFHVSVCSASNCEMARPALDVVVDVK